LLNKTVSKPRAGHVFLVEIAEPEDQIEEQFQQWVYVDPAGHIDKHCAHF
jgi:hypothetical protein